MIKMTCTLMESYALTYYRKQLIKILRSLETTVFLKSDSHLPKRKLFIWFNDSPSKLMKNSFYFILKALSVLKIFKLLSWLFRQAEKMAWLERWSYFRNLCRHSLFNKKLQHTYCSIYHKLKATRQKNFIS